MAADIVKDSTDAHRNGLLYPAADTVIVPSAAHVCEAVKSPLLKQSRCRRSRRSSQHCRP
jgi:hypothetical protein